MGKKQIVTAIVLTQVLYTQQLGPTVDQQKPFFSPVVKSLVLPGWGEYSLPRDKYQKHKYDESDIRWLHLKAFLGLLAAIAWTYFVILGKTI